MNGIKRNYTNSWETAYEWLLNDGSDTTSGPGFLEMERTAGGTGHACLLV